MAMFNHLEKTKKQKKTENLKMSSSMPVQSGLSITLVGHLSQFFQKNHMYKAVYARIVVSTKDLVELWSFFLFSFSFINLHNTKTSTQLLQITVLRILYPLYTATFKFVSNLFHLKHSYLYSQRFISSPTYISIDVFLQTLSTTAQ